MSKGTEINNLSLKKKRKATSFAPLEWKLCIFFCQEFTDRKKSLFKSPNWHLQELLELFEEVNLQDGIHVGIQVCLTFIENNWCGIAFFWCHKSYIHIDVTNRMLAACPINAILYFPKMRTKAKADWNRIT